MCFQIALNFMIWHLFELCQIDIKKHWMLGRSVTIYDNIYNRFAYYGNIENTLLGMGYRYIEKKIKMKKRKKKK